MIEAVAFDEKAAYGFLEAGIGVGNLIGGFVIGVIGTHLARGKTVIVGYAMWGACVALLAVTGNLGIAIGLMFGSGIANMVYIIPTVFSLSQVIAGTKVTTDQGLYKWPAYGSWPYAQIYLTQ